MSLPTVALLTNFIPPYRASLYAALAARTSRLRIFVSTAMEANRDWPVAWQDLDVTRQRTLTRSASARHPHGFVEENDVHVPYDTVPLLARYRPHIVISGELGLRTLQATLYRLLARRSRLIVWATLSEYSEQARGWKRTVLRRWIFSRADAVLVNGESGARYVQRFGVPRKSIFLAPYTTDMGPFAAAGERREADVSHRLFYAGQLIERKGLAAFLAALARWGVEHPARTAELWLAGDGPERASLASTVMPGNVELRFLGPVAYDDLPDAYARAGIFVLPTLADEWGVVVNEALASGMPVLGSVYSQAVEELVEDGVSGWTFRTDDPGELEGAIDRALTIPAGELEGMRRSARDAVRNLTPERVAEGIERAMRYVEAR